MNRIILITGATSGIGKACAEKFAGAGDHLIITGRRQERLDALQQELSSVHHVKVLSLCFDVQDRQAVQQQLGNLPVEWQKVDVLINNAGLALGKEPFDEASIDEWETMLNTNVHGLLYVTRAILPYLKNTGAGHIINIGSVAGKQVYADGNVYCASKFAVDALSKSMRIDLLPHGIKVTGIHPGAVETEFSLVRFRQDEQKAAATYKGFKPLTGADIAETIFFCASMPGHVCINEINITPTRQADAYYFSKDLT